MDSVCINDKNLIFFSLYKFPTLLIVSLIWYTQSCSL